MKNRVKEIIVAVSAIWLFGLTVTGCGFGPAPDGEAVVNEAESDSELSAEEENVPVEQTAKIGNTDIQGAADWVENSEMETVENEEGAEALQGSSGGRWHVLSPEVAKVMDADFAGRVWKIDVDSFYIAESQMEILEDGTLLGSSPSPDAVIPESDLIQVVFGESTCFYFRTIYDNGGRYEDTETEFQDLEEYESVEMKGVFINDVFHADEIRIIRIS